MSEVTIAVPSAAPGGVEAERSSHFGHARCFTVVRPGGGVEVLENLGHEAGGCMAMVGRLRQAGVNAVLVGGLGRRPLQMLTAAGIEVRFAEGETVADVLAAHAAGRSVPADERHVCNHDHGEHEHV
jgi:predicted Fe-Mo cluster-binding NifX family protein